MRHKRVKAAGLFGLIAWIIAVGISVAVSIATSVLIIMCLYKYLMA